MNREIELEYQVTLEDYLDGNQAITKEIFDNSWLLRTLPFFLVFFGLFCIFLGFIWFNQSSVNTLVLNLAEIDQTSETDAMLEVVGGILCLMLAPIFYLLRQTKSIVNSKSKGWQKFWEQNSVMGEARTLKANELSLTLESQTLNITFEWSALTKVLEGELVLVLCLFTGETKMLPKRMFTSEVQMNEFRQLLDRHLKKVQ
jgi:hypothetical protein